MLDGAQRHIEGRRSLLDRETTEEPQVDDLGLGRVVALELFERFVQREHGLGRIRDRRLCERDVDAQDAAAVPRRRLAPRLLDEDVAHRARGRRHEPCAVAVLLRLLARQPQPGFVDERRRLQRVPRRQVPHLGRGDVAQLALHERQQAIGRFAIAIGDGVQQLGDFGCGQGARQHKQEVAGQSVW